MLCPENVQRLSVTGSQPTGYRVDNIPWQVRPVYLGVAWALGVAIYLYYFVCRITSEIRIEGPGEHDLSRHAIYCLWHESWWPYFVAFHSHPAAHALISHPAAYMKPVHLVFRLMGVKRLFLGSSGQEGREAANRVADLVSKGWSTTISPDGPHGPARMLKKGVLHMALQSGAPVVPITLTSSRSLPLRTWDSKRIPLPFSRIRVRIHRPIFVYNYNFNTIGQQIERALGTQ